MNTNKKLLKTNKRIKILLLSVIIILLIPLIMMQFTNEVNWNVSDFVIMGILLSGTALTCEFILRNIKTAKHRVLLCTVVVFILLIVWAELAVGIFGTPFGGS